MNPSYSITPEVLRLISSISEKIGAINASYFLKPSPRLRKQNRIRTIHASLKIEGNTLSQQQITAMIENKRILGPNRDIQEVVNAIATYEHLDKYDPLSEVSFLKAHRALMNGLVEDAGNYRKNRMWEL